jgi:hypothetical protein
MRMRLVGHVARKGRQEEQKRFLCVKLKDLENLEDPGIEWRIILNIYLQEVGLGGTDWIVLAQDMYRSPAFVNAVMSSVKYEEIVDWLRNDQLGKSTTMFHGVNKLVSQRLR